MANQVTVNPWVIDTTVPNINTPGYLGPIHDAEMHNCQVEYIEYTDASHFVEVQDRYGNVVARLKGALDLKTVRTGRVGWIHGFTVPQFDQQGNPNMQSGKLVCYFE